MNMFLLDAAVEAAEKTEMTFGEKLGEGTVVAVMGLGIVFTVLILIWGLLELFKLVFYTIPTRRAEKNVPAVPEIEKSVPETEPETEEDDGALVAAITAAITAYRASENTEEYSGGFRVVSFRKKLSNK